MQKSRTIFLGTLLTLLLANLGLLYQCYRFNDIALKESYAKQRAEWMIYDGIKNIGSRLPLDTITKGHHLILRYDLATCLTCLVEAEDLLEDVFGADYLKKELCTIGDNELRKMFKNSSLSHNEIRLTPMDDIYMPYFCIINDNGDVLYTLAMNPQNYDYNKEFLNRVKKNLMK